MSDSASCDYDNTINGTLKRALHEEFGPRGIIAWSGCCRLGCTASYDEFDDSFEFRKEPGLLFIRLHLSGMNYNTTPICCYATYSSLDYLNEHWEEERGLLETWCRIVGLEEGEYEINKPDVSTKAIEIRFNEPLRLEDPREESDEEEDNYGN